MKNTPRSNKVEAMTPYDALGVEAISLARQLEMENEKLRIVLKEACEYREALCRNSDPDDEGGDPKIWDEPLRRWIKAIDI